MKTFKEFEESAVELENKIRNYLLKKKKPVSGQAFRNSMKKYDRYNEFESLVHELITDSEIELKLDGKKKVTQMKDFYKDWKHGFKAPDPFVPGAVKSTIFTIKNTFKWIGGK